MTERPITKPARPSPDVLIVGGGVVGFSIADRLAAEGLDVRLLEADAPGSGASGAAAGMLAPISEADGDSPLLRLGLASLACFEGLCARLREQTGIDPELEPSGLLHVAFSRQERAILERKHRGLEALAGEHDETIGAELELVEAEALYASGFGLAKACRGGLRSPREGHVRPPLLVRAFEASARSRGARIDPGVRVDRLRLDGRRVVGVESSAGPIAAGAVVLATGVGTPALLRASALRGAAPAAEGIEPVRGQIVLLDAPLPTAPCIVWAQGIYFVPKRDGRWVVGATEERVGFDRRVTAAGVVWLLERAQRTFPAIAGASFRSAWAGLRPVSPDGLPSIGACPEHPGLFLAAGHGRNGVLLAPITAEIVTQAILDKRGHETRDAASVRAVRPDR